MGTNLSKGFRGHTNVVVGNNVFVWGGYRHSTPLVHSSAKKQKCTSLVDAYSLLTATLVQQPTTGSPPNGIISYRTCVLGDRVYYFGGRCKSNDCFHNNLFVLDTSSYQWREIVSGTAEGPINKAACGMASFIIDGEEYLLVIGGCGPLPVPIPDHSLQYAVIDGCVPDQYVVTRDDQSRCYTSEIHMMNVSSLPGKWTVPQREGVAFPPMAFFSLNALPGNKAILFGGMCLNDRGEFYHSDRVFIMTCTKDAIEFKHLTPRPGDIQTWPIGRDGHSSAVVSSVDGTAAKWKHYLVILGGLCKNSVHSTITLEEFWIMDVEDKSWKQIALPEVVTKRYDHSMTSLMMSKNCYWLLITGGRLDRVNVITGPNTVMIVELVYSENEWKVTNIMNSDELRKYCSKAMFQCLAKGRGENQTLLHDFEQQLKKCENEKDIQIKTLQQQLDEQSDMRLKLEVGNRELLRQNEALQQQCSRLDELLRQNQEQLSNKAAQLDQETRRNEHLNQQVIEQTEVIQLKQATIQRLQHQMENSSWVLQREEIELTREKIGGGAYGEVKVAIFRGIKVAAKCIHSLIVSEYNIGKIMREMELCSRVHHPNIVQFIGATKTNSPILLYELMTASLHDLLHTSQPLMPSQIVGISSDVCSALAYLHLLRPEPIIHRDVSSPNVLLEMLGTGKWRTKLSDFGSANFQFVSKSAHPGNPAYAAPEASSPDQHSPAMDVYSLGVLMTELLLHSPPEMSVSKREETTSKISWIAMRTIIISCIARNPGQRLSSSQLLEELQKL